MDNHGINWQPKHATNSRRYDPGRGQFPLRRREHVAIAPEPPWTDFEQPYDPVIHPWSEEYHRAVGTAPVIPTPPFPASTSHPFELTAFNHPEQLNVQPTLALHSDFSDPPIAIESPLPHARPFEQLIAFTNNGSGTQESQPVPPEYIAASRHSTLAHHADSHHEHLTQVPAPPSPYLSGPSPTNANPVVPPPRARVPLPNATQVEWEGFVWNRIREYTRVLNKYDRSMFPTLSTKVVDAYTRQRKRANLAESRARKMYENWLRSKDLVASERYVAFKSALSQAQGMRNDRDVRNYCLSQGPSKKNVSEISGREEMVWKVVRRRAEVMDRYTRKEVMALAPNVKESYESERRVSNLQEKKAIEAYDKWLEEHGAAPSKQYQEFRVEWEAAKNVNDRGAAAQAVRNRFVAATKTSVDLEESVWNAVREHAEVLHKYSKEDLKALNAEEKEQYDRDRERTNMAEKRAIERFETRLGQPGLFPSDKYREYVRLSRSRDPWDKQAYREMQRQELYSGDTSRSG
ncbi:hypothetical protein JCM16303_006873 [Sporobolomyces ruberrimus]